MTAPKRLLVLATYPETAACTRFRVTQFRPDLRARGIEIDFHPFLDDAFFEQFYRPGGAFGKAARLARASVGRLLLLVRARGYDGVLVQREASLVGPALVEAALAKGFRLPLVFDYDDAIWLQAEPTGGAARRLAAKLLKFPSKTDDLIRMATAVVAGSRHLAAHALAFTSNVTVLPTVVRGAQWRPLEGRLDGAFATRSGPPTIGWIGTHSTAAQLDLVVPALRRLAAEGHRFRVRLVGASRNLQIPGVEVESVPWALEREIADFQNVDVGIAPMFSDAWSEGKCAFKQVQYMAVGVPMVSSLVGGARDFLRHGENALIAHTEHDWCAHLATLLTDASVRARLATNGRALFERELSAEAVGPKLADVIARALSSS